MVAQHRYDCATPFSALLSGLAEMILAERNVGLPSTPVFMAIVGWLGVPGWDAVAGALDAAAYEADEVANDRWSGEPANA